MPTFKFDDEHGGTVEVSVKTTHRDGEHSPLGQASARRVHLAPIQRAMDLDPSGVTPERVLLSDIYSQIRKYRRLLGKCAASLHLHNTDREYLTPAQDIDELLSLSTETGKYPPPFGATDEGTPCKRPLPSADAAPPVNEWQPVIDMLNFAGSGVVHHPDAVCAYLCAWQRDTAQAAASLEQHNIDREYETPAEDIERLKSFGPSSHQPAIPGGLTLTWYVPFGHRVTFGASEDLRATLPRKTARASTFGAGGQRVLVDHALEYTSEEVASHLKRLWEALGCADTRGGAWADALGVVKYLAAQEVAHLHAATHASMQLSQLWEALGRAEGSRGDWADALETVKRLATHAPEVARVPDHSTQVCWCCRGKGGSFENATAHTDVWHDCTECSGKGTKLEYELQRIANASEDELDAIGRVLDRKRPTIGRPPSYIETVDEYRTELTRLTKVKHS